MQLPQHQNKATTGRQFSVFFGPDDGEPPLPDEGPPAAEPPRLSATMTLVEFFERWFVPVYLARLSPATKASYTESLDHWLRLTLDPPLCEIDDYHCTHFVTGLAALPGRKFPTISTWTQLKHCRQVQTVLDHTGPRSDKTPRAKQLIDLVPSIEKPHVDREPPEGDFSFAELQAMLGVVDQMTWPRIEGVAPSDWWRAILTFDYYTGLRIGALLAVQWSHIEGEWLRVPARERKTGKQTAKHAKGQMQFLVPEAIAAIEVIRTSRQFVFQWPTTSKLGGVRWLHTQLKRLLVRAGIPAERRFAWHGIRKSHLTDLAAINPLAAQLSANHADLRVTMAHYVNPRIQKDAMCKLPRLAAKKPCAGQRALF